jgi:hypothetical protein
MTIPRLELILLGLSAVMLRTSAAQDTPPNPSAAPNHEGVTKEEIKKFLEAQISEDAIISYIRKHPPNPPICCDDLTDLKRSGASDDLIKTLIEAESPSAGPSQALPPADSDVSPEEYPESSPQYYYSPGYSYPYPSYYYYPPPSVFFFHDPRFDRDRRVDRFRRPEGVGRFRNDSQAPSRPAPQTSRPPAQGATPRGGALPREGSH